MKFQLPISRLIAFPLAALLVASSAEAPAQEAETAASATSDGQPKPRLPLVPRAPNRAEWTIRMTTDFGEAWESSGAFEQTAEAMGDMRTIQSVDFSKDANVQSYRLRTRWSDGESEDEWIVMGHHVAERAGGRGLYIVGSEATTTQELAKIDFPELSWVEMTHYRGLKTHKGQPVFVFGVPFDKKRLSSDEARIMDAARQSDPKTTPTKVFKPKTKEVVLFLDAKTQLPVLYNDGMTLRQYSFGQTPTSGLRPPAEVLAFLRSRDAALRARLTPPAGPGG